MVRTSTWSVIFNAMEFKYIMVETLQYPNLKRYIPIIFPSLLAHADVFEGIKDRLPGRVLGVRSAGIVLFGSYGAECHDKSTTLKVCAHEDDDEIITNYPYKGGLEV